MRSTRSRAIAGLSALLGGIGLLIAGKAATTSSASMPPALPALPVLTAPPSAEVARPSESSVPASPSHGRPPSGPRTVDGDVVQTPYGPVQVAVVFDNGRIVDVRALQTPSDAEHSVRLAELATPVLRSEVLSAQSARVDSVSGATYTSAGYVQSVQYALDHASG